MKNQKILAKMWGKRNPYTLLVGVNAGTAIRKPMWRSYKKAKIELSCEGLER